MNAMRYMNVRGYLAIVRREHERSLSESACPGSPDRRLNLLLAVACAIASLVLMETGGYTGGFDFLYRSGAHLPGPWLQGLSTLGETLPGLCLFALLARRQPRALWMGALASIYATTLTQGLKHLLNAARPPAVLGDWVAVHGEVLKSHSFPSGHTATAFLLAACFSVGASRRTRVLIYALATSVGLSRVWLGVHWPMDVLAGAGIASLSVSLAIQTTERTRTDLALAPHCFLISLVAFGAALQLATLSEDPTVRVFEVAIAAAALSIIVRDYVFRPIAHSQRNLSCDYSHVSSWSRRSLSPIEGSQPRS